MMKKNKLIGMILLLSTTVAALQAQDATGESSWKVNLGSDIVSSYVWRGTAFGHSPAIQPTLSLAGHNFEIGCWGSAATNNDFKEVDLYAKYTVKGLTLTVTDYYVPSADGVPLSPDNRFFMYADKETAHTLEASLQFTGPESFPIRVLGGVFLYGNDKRWGYDIAKDSTNSSYYSAYVEAGYTFALKNNTLDLFLGMTPKAGAYGNGAGLVNAGLSVSRNIRITNDFDLPVKGSLIVNPQASEVYFVFGITI
jgi:hypothetical protein